MYLALGLADQAFADEGAECVVTAALEGQHNAGTLHGAGFAVDLRSSQLTPEQHARVLGKLMRLNRYGFDVVNELAGATAMTTAQHFHIEFQPKNGETFWHVL
jgi:hypothetical protein